MNLITRNREHYPDYPSWLDALAGKESRKCSEEYARLNRPRTGREKRDMISRKAKILTLGDRGDLSLLQIERMYEAFCDERVADTPLLSRLMSRFRR